MKKNVFKMSKEEEALLKNVENIVAAGKQKSFIKEKGDLQKYEDIFKENLKKNKVITIRISGELLEGLKSDAMEEGVNYQTLITSVLHKYHSGKYLNAKEVKAVFENLKIPRKSTSGT